ncbi:MAG: UDP-N-acetylmuramoylalanyl-D-glutamyl-2, 6-diaminopimelate--D-alanyl-D-alanine ligase, partial [Rhodospirillales bacterium]
GLAGDLKAAGVELLYACGPAMRRLYDALPAKPRGAHAANSAELAPRVVGAVRAGDVVLVKGSLGSRMALIVAALLALSDSPPQAANGN